MCRTRAAAKINWTLEVLGRRADGYHEIRSVMQTIDICDELSLKSGGEPVLGQDLVLGVKGQGAASEDDIVLRVAREVLGEDALKATAKFRLKKVIPYAAGLGGGSSDGAAAARLLDRALDLGYDAERMAAILARVSSDAPFFAYGGTALVSGRGESVEPLPDVQETWVVVLAPPFEVERKTARMYAMLGGEHFTDGAATDEFARAAIAGEAPRDGLLFNAFEAVATQAYPGIERYLKALGSTEGRAVHLAGSGPALFRLADGSEHADETAAEARARVPDARVFAARSLTAAEAVRIDPLP